MSMQLDAALVSTGTRFRLFAQSRFLPAFSVPETVIVSQPPGLIKIGPEDDRMFVVDAIDKIPYDFPGALPPQQTGPRMPSVPAGPDGHFDHLDPDSREFKSATMYATVRRTLDIWQDYHGGKIEWFFRGSFPKMLLIPAVEWDNAQSGFGFLEFGFGRKLGLGGTPVIDHNSPFCENFDVLAHEIGHNILFTLVGLPENGANTVQYGGFQESGGDLTAIVAVLHFNSVVDHVLANSKGNLFTVNELSRLGELSNGREIRRAFNALKMSQVDNEPHNLSQPLTGAIFDIFVDAFQMELVRRGLITQQLADRSQFGKAPESELPAINAAFAAAYAGHEAEFKTALLTARDYLGRLLARTWADLSPNFLTYIKVLSGLLDADQDLTNGVHARSIRECFTWREIQPALPVGLMIRRLSDIGMDDLLEPDAEYNSEYAPQAYSAADATAPAPFIEGRTPANRPKPKPKPKKKGK
jgi:hypothetical protein